MLFPRIELFWQEAGHANFSNRLRLGVPNGPYGFADLRETPYALRHFHSIGRKGQGAQPYAHSIEYRIADSGRNAHKGDLTRAHGRLVLTVNENRIDNGQIAEARHTVAGEAVGGDLSVFE